MAEECAKPTDGPWRVARMFTEEQEAEARELGLPHLSGYFRENDGSFIIMGVADDGEAQRVGSVNLIGHFKRTERYRADDPIALANAHLVTAAPDLKRELAHLVALMEPLERDGSLNIPGVATLNGARAALAKAEGRA